MSLFSPTGFLGAFPVRTRSKSSTALRRAFCFLFGMMNAKCPPFLPVSDKLILLNSPDGRRLLAESQANERLCLAGAQMVSEDFLAFYLRSTFLADGKTSLEKFEHLRPELSQQPKAG